MGLTDFTVKLIGPKIIINAIEKQDAKALGTDAAKIVDKAFDAEFGPLKSEKIQQVLVPFIGVFITAFNDELIKP